MPKSQKLRKKTNRQIHSEFIISDPDRDTGRMFIDKRLKKGKTKMLAGKIIINKNLRYIVLGKDSKEPGRYVVDKF